MQFKLPSAGELGLFSGLAASRTRLTIVSAVGVLGALGYGRWLSRFLEITSESVTVNMVLIAAQFFIVIIVGYVLAMSVGSYVFGDIWRDRTLVRGEAGLALSDAVELDDVDEEHEIEAFKDHTIAFYALIVASVLFSYGAVIAVAGNYVSRYNEIGFYRTLLRNDDPLERIRALRTLVDPVFDESAENSVLRGDLAGALDDPDSDVAAWAAWACGQLGILDGQPGLLRLLSDAEQPVAVRAEAAIALGRLRDPEAERRMAAMLPDAVQTPELANALVTALGLVPSSFAVPTLQALLGSSDLALDTRLLWAIRRTRSLDPRKTVLERWDAAETLQERCAVAEALKSVTTIADVQLLKEAFSTLTPGEACEEVRFEVRPYADDQPIAPVVYIVREELRQKLVTAVFNIRPPGIDEWLAEIAWAPAETDALKIYADNLYKIVDGEPLRVPRE
ncbi:MAG: hypothetical protein ACI81R_003164, partial [Bradymonadia bacterium]|jgi:hypothetical protein